MLQVEHVTDGNGVATPAPSPQEAPEEDINVHPGPSCTMSGAHPSFLLPWGQMSRSEGNPREAPVSESLCRPHSY